MKLAHSQTVATVSGTSVFARCGSSVARHVRLLSCVSLMLVGASAGVASTSVGIGAPQSYATYSGTVNFGGWAMDTNNLIKSIAISIDGLYYGYYGGAMYGGNRQDACNAQGNYPGCPNVGWNFPVNTASLNNGTHSFVMTVETSDGRVTNWGDYFYTNNSTASLVDIDTPQPNSYSGQLGIGGWTLDHSTTISEVKLFVDGAFIGNASYGGNRQDACNANGNPPGCPYVGWNYLLNTTALGNGAHRLAVTSVTTDGRETVGEQYFTLNNSGITLVDIDTPWSLQTYFGTIGFGGWALNPSSTITSVALSIDDVPFGNVSYGGNRQDACAANGNPPGCPYVGWNYALDTTTLKDGLHTVTLTATTANNRIGQASQYFFVTNAPDPFTEDFSGGAVDGTPGCNPPSFSVDSKAMYGDPGNDGLIHVTYDINGTTDSFTQGVIRSAIADWNSHSATTGVRFQEVPAGSSGVDLQIQPGTNAQANSCAAYSPVYNTIFFSAIWPISSDNKGIMLHELGHFLGLKDAGTNPSTPTIMNNPSNMLCTSPNVPTTTLQPTDWSTVNSCRVQVRSYIQKANQAWKKIHEHQQSANFTVPPPPGQTQQTCYYTYSSVNFYVDGVYDSSEQFIEGVTCF